MKGYHNIATLCVCVRNSFKWIFEPDITFFVKDVDISLSGKYDKLGKRVDAPSALANELRSMYHRHSAILVTEWSARWNIKRKTHIVEMECLTRWMEYVCIPNGWMYRWPVGQSLSHDIEVDMGDGCGWKRVQMKTAQPHCASSRASGFTMPLMHQAGYVNGKPTHKPYSTGDADLYIAMMWTDDVIDTWTFHESELYDYLATETRPGKRRISIHLPAHLSNERVNDGVATSKGGPLNRTLWTRGNHVRRYTGSIWWQ
jgi:hypothetical protein